MPNRVTQVRRLNYNGEDIGMGFNSDTGLGVGTALDFAAPTGDLAQEAQAEISIVTSHEQLMNSLHMSAQLEGRYAFASGGAKADFATKTDYNSSSTFVVAKMVITNTVQRGRDFKLKPDLQHLLDTLQMDVFDTAFGDSFVRAHYRGGEFYAIMRITSVDSKTESDLAVSLHGELQSGLASVDFKGALNTANQNAKTRSEFSVKFYQKGGLGREEIGATLDIDEIKARLKAFPDAIKNHPFPFFIEVATYDTIPLPLPTKEQREAFIQAMDDAHEKKLRYLQAHNDCAFAAEHPEYFFEPPARAVLLTMAATYLQLVNGVMSHAVRLSKGEINPPQLFDPSKLAPPVAEPEITLRKRDVGLEAGFVDFWTTKDKPATRHTDRDLVVDIGFLAIEQLNDFNAIADPGGDPQKTLRLQGEALSRIVASLQTYDWDHAGMHSASRGKLTSLSKLPIMLPKTIKTLAFQKNEIDDIEGIEQFAALVDLDLSHNRVATLEEVGKLSTLRTLRLVDNRIATLEPLGRCAALETLDISGNDITDLTPLKGCAALKNLTLSGTMLFDGTNSHRSGNPIINAKGISEVVALANPFTVGNVLSVRSGVLRDGPAAQFTGVATRIGASNSFRVRLTRGAEVVDVSWDLRAISAVTPADWDPEILRGMMDGATPSDLPISGAQVMISKSGEAQEFVGICYADPANPTTAVIDVQAFPLFATKFPFPTLDATVVS